MISEEELKKLSFEGAPLIKVIPPGPKSQEILSYQMEHESSAVSYPKGGPQQASYRLGPSTRVGYDDSNDQQLWSRRGQQPAVEHWYSTGNISDHSSRRIR